MARAVVLDDLEPTAIAALAGFRFQRGHPMHDGTLDVWEAPVEGHRYSVGADFAKGIEGRDLDAALVFDRDARPRPREVALLRGRWGEEFDRPLYALLRWYNNAFLVGEAQEGLAILRRLFRRYKYRRMWHDRDPTRKAQQPRLTDRLGYWRRAADPVFEEFIRGVLDRAFDIRSPAVLEQMGHLQWVARDSVREEEVTDDDLRMKLATGGSPDLVMAGVYGWWGVLEAPKFLKRSEETYGHRTAGDILDHDEPFQGADGPVKVGDKRRRRASARPRRSKRRR